MAISRRTGSRARSRITRQGQITVPKVVRDALGVQPGDELEFEIRDDAAIVHPRRRPSILAYAGIAGERSKRLPRTAAELDELILEAKSERASQRMRR